MTEPRAFTVNPSPAQAAAWREANRQLRRPSRLREIGIRRTSDWKFAVGACRFKTLPEAVVQARLEQARSETLGRRPASQSNPATLWRAMGEATIIANSGCHAGPSSPVAEGFICSAGTSRPPCN
jgi:hypothetical protein